VVLIKISKNLIIGYDQASKVLMSRRFLASYPVIINENLDEKIPFKPNQQLLPF